MIVLAIPIFLILNSLFGNIGFNDTVNIAYGQSELTNRIDSNTTQTVSIKDIPIKKVHVGDIDIAYKMIGKGEPLLLISGLGGDMNGWEASTLVELSSSNHTVIVFDNRGAGNTTMGTKPFSIQQFANDTAGLIDGLKIQKTDVLGYSMGSFVAQQLTLTHPERVSRLILHGASCGGKEGVSPNPEVIELRKKLVNSIATNIPIEQHELKSALAVTLGPTWMKLHPKYIDTIPTNTDDMLSGITSNAYIKQFNAVMSWYSSDWSGVCGQLPSTNKPTLIITGTDDIAVPADNSLVLTQKIPGPWLVQSEGAGHALVSQYPNEFNKILQTFLTITGRDNQIS